MPYGEVEPVEQAYMLQFVLDYHRACVVPVAAAEHYCAGGAERCHALVVGYGHAD